MPLVLVVLSSVLKWFLSSKMVLSQHVGHALHKGVFRDALALRYGWLPSSVPSECVSGKAFSVEHAMHVMLQRRFSNLTPQ